MGSQKIQNLNFVFPFSWMYLLFFSFSPFPFQIPEDGSPI